MAARTFTYKATGPDKGAGGKYVLSGPGQKVEVPKGAYHAESPTMNLFWGFRALDKDPAKADALLQALRTYPMSKSASPPPTRLVDITGKRWTQTPPRGMEYWKSLHAIIQREPVHERDRFFMAMLAPLGIEKGKPFTPDPSQRAEFYDQLDQRAARFYEAVTTSSGMVTKTPGVGQVYLGTYQDKDGDWLDGAKNYRLRIPPNAPVAQFWSMTVYDLATRALIDNPTKQADRSSRMDLQKNPDGSVDLYVGPLAYTSRFPMLLVTRRFSSSCVES